MFFRLSFLSAMLLASAPAGAQVRIYTFLDESGQRHFTDVPDNSRYRLLHLSPNDLTASGQHYDPHLLARSRRYDPMIEQAAAAAAVEPNLLRAVIVVESGFNSRAVSKRGAIGLMQLMPATAVRYGVSDPYDARENISGGAHYLKFLMDLFGHDVSLALAAYNAGEAAVLHNGGQIPRNAETQAYVPRVMRIFRMLGAAPSPL
jgi:soluble lytic murein transglycosylase-like protein